MAALTSIEPYLEGEIDPAFAARARIILGAVADRRPGRLLDAGCGRGFYLRMASLLAGDARIVGVDSHAGHLRRARRFVRDRMNVEVARCDVARLPFPDASFDFIICSEVIEHLTDDAAALRELRRVLAPGGTVAISVPCRDFPFSWDPINWALMRIAGWHVPKHVHWLAGIWADHERLYSAHDLQDRVGLEFEVTAVHGVIRCAWPFSHLLLYGLGKNLVEHLGWSAFDRFSPAPPSSIRRVLARVFALPSRLAGRRGAERPAVNLVVTARG